MALLRSTTLSALSNARRANSTNPAPSITVVNVPSLDCRLPAMVCRRSMPSPLLAKFCRADAPNDFTDVSALLIFAEKLLSLTLMSKVILPMLAILLSCLV